MTYTHWKKLENPDYVGAYAFQPDEVKTVTIKDVKREMVRGTDGKKQEKTTVSFVEDVKPLVLNRTNGKMISKVLGTSYIEMWTGGRINLHVEVVPAFGERVEAVRVMKDKPPQIEPAKPIICADCNEPIKAVGSFSAQRIAQRSMETFGCNLCMTCAQKRKEAQSKEAQSDVQGE